MDLSTLNPGAWLGEGLLDYFILHEALENRRLAQMFYVPSFIIRDWHDRFSTGSFTVTPEDGARLRRALALHPTDPIPRRRLAFVLFHDQHFSAIVMDHRKNRTYAFGRKNVDHDDGVSQVMDNWNDWNGPCYWSVLAECLGWSVHGLDFVSSHGINWKWVSLLSPPPPLLSFLF
jgi:hypothetical protein